LEEGTIKAGNVTEEEVLTVLKKFTENYTKRDMEGVMSLFAPDADVVVFGTEADEKRIGLGGIKAQLERDWSLTEALSVEYNWTFISAAGPVAWVAAEAVFKAKVDGQNLILPYRVTKVLEKRGEKWLIVQGHFSSPDARQRLWLF